MPALELDAVRKVYPSGDTEVVALDHATLTVGDDEIVALVGPSGSGKTTMLSIAGGLLSPTEGSVVVGGQEISRSSSRELTRFRPSRSGSCSRRSTSFRSSPRAERDDLGRARREITRA